MNPGERIGPYTLDKRLGSGGMGEVWAARGPEGPVAVKVIPEFLSWDKGLIERLERESEAARRLEHPGIARVIGFGTEDERPYLVMELLFGKTLAERLDEAGSLPLEEIEGIAVSVAEALAFCHSRGVIHRDLKPENIYITAGGRIKLIDLGVAKVLDEASLTMTGSHFGTPAYMSPEAFRDSKSVSGATDIWSLGVILYQAATGRLPYPGTSAASIIARISDPNISPQAPNLVREDIPHELASLISSLLNRDPEGRPSAADIVERLTGKRPVFEPAPSGPDGPVTRPILLSLAAYYGAALLIGIIGTGAIAAFWSYSGAEAPTRMVVSESGIVEVHDGGTLTDTGPDEAGVNPPDSGAQTAPDTDLDDETILRNRLALAEAGGRADEIGQAHCDIGGYLQSSGDHERAIEEYDAAIAADPSPWAFYYMRGFSKLALDDRDGAIEDYRRAVDLGGNENALLNLAFTLRLANRPDEALSFIDRGLERVGENNRYRFLVERARILADLGRIEEARADLDAALEMVPEDQRAWVERMRDLILSAHEN